MAPPRPRPPRQLPLPVLLPMAAAPPLPVVAVAPADVWHALAPSQQAQCRQVLVALLQEVTRVGDAPGEDHPAAP